jgi:serine/threonine protein kinase
MSFINVVNQSGKKYKIDLNKEVNRGGEGVIYELDNNTVAKIYHDGIEPLNQAKFDFLKKLDKTLFIAPQELLFDSKSIVKGFTMEYLDNTFYPLSSLFTKSFCASHNVDKKVKLKVIENLIKALEYAHRMKVVVGDLNCFNVMVNNSGDIKLIDTDSYQVPGFFHSGRLLDDIRDFFYQGRVDENSDFYALSILSFNMLSFTHPFKGIHKQYMKLSDRVIHKIPVFANDSDLTVPKCYEPIQDPNLMGQFRRFYMNGERFLMSLSNINANLVVISVNQPSLVRKYEQDDLIITSVSGDIIVENVFCTDNQMVVETEKDFLIYNTKNKGYVTLADTISKAAYDQVFVGNTNILFRKGSSLFAYNKNSTITQINSFTFPAKYIQKQYENILVVIDYDNMYKIFIDDVFGSVIKLSTVNVFGKGFQSYKSFMYNSGGKQNVFYNESGKEMSIVNLPVKIQDLYQQKNVGIIQYIEKKEIKYKFFKVKDLKLNVSQNEISNWSDFAFRADKDGEGFIFMPVDDAIKVVRTQDFAEVSELKCSLVSSESTLKNTNAGLILFDNQKIWLLNKK